MPIKTRSAGRYVSSLESYIGYTSRLFELMVGKLVQSRLVFDPRENVDICDARIGARIEVKSSGTANPIKIETEQLSRFEQETESDFLRPHLYYALCFYMGRPGTHVSGQKTDNWKHRKDTKTVLYNTFFNTRDIWLVESPLLHRLPVIGGQIFAHGGCDRAYKANQTTLTHLRERVREERGWTVQQHLACYEVSIGGRVLSKQVPVHILSRKEIFSPSRTLRDGVTVLHRRWTNDVFNTIRDDVLRYKIA